MYPNLFLELNLADLTQTKQIQLQLADCGWETAADLCQQDASEAFTFITSSLALPLYVTFRKFLPSETCSKGILLRRDYSELKRNILKEQY